MSWQNVIGALLVVAGLIPLVFAFVEFAKAHGTPMPLAPPDRLVVVPAWMPRLRPWISGQ